MKNHFDTVAQSWDKNLMHIQRTNAIADELIKILGTEKKQKALEFGAGTGLLSIALKDYFSEIILMDSSKEMVNVTKDKLAKENSQHLKPIFFDLEKEHFNDKIFDCIFSQMALHHVLNVDEIMSKFYQMLNPFGILAIADLYEEDGSFHDQEFNGHFGFNPDNLVVKFEKLGFKDVSYKHCFEIVKPDGPKMGMSYPVFLLTGKK